MSSEQERRELETRVFSRAGADDPRTERVDPDTGRVLLLTDSEWRLLEADRRSALVGGTRRIGGVGSPTPTRRADASTADRARDRDGPIDVSSHPAPRRRRRVAHLVLVAALAATAAAAITTGVAVTTGIGILSLEPGAAGVEATVVPRAPAAAGAIAGSAAAGSARGPGTLAVFLDPDRTHGSLPGWLEKSIPSSRVAQLASPAGPIAGVGIYAVTTPDLIACLIARIEAEQMVWSCTPVRELTVDGLVLRTAIPEGLGSRLDRDGDGISGDAAQTDLLVVEWHADGTFRIAREAG